MEIYKQIQEFANYEISNFGNVRNIKTKRVLKQRIAKRGYYQLNLFRNNKSYSVKIHRLVAITHINNPYMLPEVDHIDRNRLNNHIENLRWTDRAENLNNRIAGNNPYITYNDINNTFVIYEPKHKQFYTYNGINETVQKFISLLPRINQ